MAAKTIFKRIIDREIPADIVYEDERALAFRDIKPEAPAHVLIIPKQEIPSLAQATDADAALLGHLLDVARRLAVQLGLVRRISRGDQLRARRRAERRSSAPAPAGRARLGWPPG